MINKKSQISATLTWVVGFLIIFFIMFLFTSATLTIAKARQAVKENNEIGFEKANSLLTYKNFIFFMESSVEINNKQEKMADLFAGYYFDKKYNKEIQENFDKVFEPLQYCISGKAGKYYYRTYLIEVVKDESESKHVSSLSYFKTSKENSGMEKYLIASQTFFSEKGKFVVRLYKSTSETYYFLKECIGRGNLLYFE